VWQKTQVRVGQLPLSRHWGAGQRPEGNSTTTVRFGAGGSSRRFPGEHEVGRLRVLQGGGISGATWEAAGTVGRLSQGQAGNERVQSWGLHNGDCIDRKQVHRKRSSFSLLLAKQAVLQSKGKGHKVTWEAPC